MDNECIICDMYDQPAHCAGCHGTVCDGCMHKLGDCEQCGEYDLCPKCIDPENHICTEEEEKE